MKALVFHKPKHVSVDTQPDPRIERPRDVILKVTATAICGSDLHIYNGFFPQPKPFVLGHEFMGIVEEVGSEVRDLRRGDRVVVPFPIACGACWFCKRGFPTQCETSNAKHYGPEGATTHDKGGGLFGYTDLYGGYRGGQAQYVRVPFADYGPSKVPDGVPDEAALFLSDIVPTAYSALKWAGLEPGESVAVWGCGPVGLQAQRLARILGAGLVIGVDIEPDRLLMARRFADSRVVNADTDDAVRVVRALTGGRGADVVIEAIGMEVNRSLLEKASNMLHMQAGSISAVEHCFSAARRCGRVSILGVYGATYANFPLGQWVDKGLRVQAGQAWVHDYIDELMRLVVEKKLQAETIITHKLPLHQAPHGYEIFNDKKEGCVKVVLDPWAS